MPTSVQVLIRCWENSVATLGMPCSWPSTVWVMSIPRHMLCEDPSDMARLPCRAGHARLRRTVCASHSTRYAQAVPGQPHLGISVSSRHARRPSDCFWLITMLVLACFQHQRIHWHWMLSCNMSSEKGGSARSVGLACRLAAAASLSSCIISRAVTVLLASEAREFFWALDSLSFVCNQF